MNVTPKPDPVDEDTEIKILEQSKVDLILSEWERTISRLVEDFKRYSKSIVDLDTTMFECVERLHTIQKQQDETEARQKYVTALVTKVETKQRKMLDAIRTMEARASAKPPDGSVSSSRRAKVNELSRRAMSLNHQIQELEDEVTEVTEHLNNIQAKAYPDALQQLVTLTSSNSKALQRASDNAAKLYQWLRA